MRKSLVSFAVATIITGQAAWATDYTITTFDFPGATSTNVTGINATGRIVGFYLVPTITGELGFTERNGVYTSVGDSLPCRPSGRCRTSVSFLNAVGQFAGTFSGDVDFPGAFIQTVSTAPAIVQPPEYPDTAIQLAGLNDLGVLAGCYSNLDSLDQIFVQVGGYFRTITLPVADVQWACANGVNNLGQLAGLYNSGAALHGFVLTGPHMRTFDLPPEWGAQDLEVFAINDRGVVIGEYDTADSSQGFRVSGDQIEQIVFPGATVTRPIAINDRNEILGTYTLPATDTTASETHTFVLRDGVYSTLTLPLPGPGTVAGFDNFGRFFGSYTDAICTPTCLTHGFIATPKTE